MHLFFNRMKMTQKSIQQTQLSVKNVCQLIQNKVESDLKYTSQVSRTWIFTDLESSLKTSEWTFWSTIDDFHVIFLFRDNFDRMLLLGFLCLAKSWYEIPVHKWNCHDKECHLANNLHERKLGSFKLSLAVSLDLSICCIKECAMSRHTCIYCFCF